MGRDAISSPRDSGDVIDDADTIEGAREVVRGEQPGRYSVDEIWADPFPSGRTIFR